MSRTYQQRIRAAERGVLRARRAHARAVDSLRAQIPSPGSGGLTPFAAQVDALAGQLRHAESTLELLRELHTVTASGEGGPTVRLLERALKLSRKVFFRYTDGDGAHSDRIVHPASVPLRSTGWSLLGWCETREEYRSFRLDRMRDLTLLDERFVPTGEA